jgi:hypothetical protein
LANTKYFKILPKKKPVIMEIVCKIYGAAPIQAKEFCFLDLWLGRIILVGAAWCKQKVRSTNSSETKWLRVIRVLIYKCDDIC